MRSLRSPGLADLVPSFQRELDHLADAAEASDEPASSTAPRTMKPMPASALKMTDDPTHAWEITRASQGEPGVLIDIERRQAPGVHAHWELDELPKQPENTVRFVSISDTHSYESKSNLKGPTAFESIPDGDVLLHCGDFTNVGRLEEVQAFAKWFGALPHKRKILIAGNHDLSMEPATYAATSRRFGGVGRGAKALDAAAVCRQARAAIEAIPNCSYLEDSGTEVDGIRIWGSPWQPEFCEWAFNLPRGEACRAKWRRIPAGTDVVLTHGPPLGHGDQCLPSGARAGCADLLDELQQRVRPKYHVFGHIHEGWGVTTDGVTRYVNASTCNLRYKPVNTPIVFDVARPVTAQPTEPPAAPLVAGSSVPCGEHGAADGGSAADARTASVDVDVC